MNETAQNETLKREINAILARNPNEKFLRALLTRALTLERLFCKTA